MPPVDPLDWAKHPRSDAALCVLVRGAKDNRKLREILEGLKAINVVSQDGTRLLVCWNGARWEQHRSG